MDEPGDEVIDGLGDKLGMAIFWLLVDDLSWDGVLSLNTLTKYSSSSTPSVSTTSLPGTSSATKPWKGGEGGAKVIWSKLFSISSY